MKHTTLRPILIKHSRNVASHLAVLCKRENAGMHRIYHYTMHSCSILALAHFWLSSTNAGTYAPLCKGCLHCRQDCFCAGRGTFLHKNNPQRRFPMRISFVSPFCVLQRGETKIFLLVAPLVGRHTVLTHSQVYQCWWIWECVSIHG